MLNLVCSALIILAALWSVFVAGSLLLWVKGADMVALPGLGLIIATPLISILLIVAQLGLVVLAAAVCSFAQPPAP